MQAQNSCIAVQTLWGISCGHEPSHTFRNARQNNSCDIISIARISYVLQRNLAGKMDESKQMDNAFTESKHMYSQAQISHVWHEDYRRGLNRQSPR